jgi:hypothetical protein
MESAWLRLKSIAGTLSLVVIIVSLVMLFALLSIEVSSGYILWAAYVVDLPAWCAAACLVWWKTRKRGQQ